MRHLFFGAVLASFAVLLVSCGPAASNAVTASFVNAEGFNEIDVRTIQDASKAITFEWRVTQNVNLEGRVTAPTIGWVAVGFKPSVQMLNANIIIGYVDNTGAHMVDGFGTSSTSWSPDTSIGGQDNIISSSGSILGGTSTRIQFIIPLNSGDNRDQALSAGETFAICLAYGVAKNNSNSSGNQHTNNATATIKL